MDCKRCGYHRPGVNDKGLCPSCVRFGGEAPPMETKEASRSISSPQRGLREITALITTLERQTEAVEAKRQANMLRYGCPVCGQPSQPNAYFLCDEHFILAAKCIREAGVQDLAKIKATLRRMEAPPSWADEEWVAEECGAAAFRIKFSGATGSKPDAITPQAPLKTNATSPAAATTVPLSQEALELAALLTAEEFPELAEAVLTRRVPELDDEERTIIDAFAQRVRLVAPTVLNPTTVQNSLVQVTTSGWGKESDTTLPGAIQPLMQVD